MVRVTRSSDPVTFDISPLVEMLVERRPRLTDVCLSWGSGEDAGHTPTESLLDEMAALRTVRGLWRVLAMTGEGFPAPLPAWINVRLGAIQEELRSRGASTLMDAAFRPRIPKRTIGRGPKPLVASRYECADAPCGRWALPLKLV
jgi:hypothetical protein